jgi:hypothetical protein
VTSDETNFKTSEKTDAEKKADDDSITEEVADLRISEAAKEHSEWV